MLLVIILPGIAFSPTVKVRGLNGRAISG